MLNKVTLIGNLGRDPEIRRTKSGDPIANFSIATTEKWKDQSGEQQEKTEWHKVSVFGKLAGVVESYVKKGSKVYVEGKLQTRKWDDDGITKYATEVVLSGFDSKLIMLGGNNSGSTSAAKVAKEPKPAAQQAAMPDILDDEIPF